MATIGNKFVDLIDIYSKMDGMGQINAVIEMLMEMNPILTDAMAVECNSGTRHKHTVQTGLPSVSWGRLYGAIAQSKGRSAQVEDTTGFVEALSTVDERLLKLSGNSGAVRLAEAKGFLEAMNQEVASRIFYGNTATDADQFMGLAPRFSDLSAPNGNQIIDAGGTGGDNTSIWFVTWGENQTQLLYPKGTQAGVMRKDMGLQRIAVGDEGAYYAYEEMFSWHVGLAVKDWRYVSRVANIDVSEMQAGNVALYDFLRKAYYQGQNRRIAGGSQAIYCNRDVLEALDALATNAGASDNFVRLQRKDVEGEEVLSYRGIPIRESDALINTEARVV